MVIDLGIIEEEDLLVMLATHMGTTVVSLPEMDVPEEVLRSIPSSVARMYSVVPVEANQDSVVLATANIVGPELVDEIRFVLTKDVSVVVAGNRRCWIL